MGELYFFIRETDGGYDYSIYGDSYNLLDGCVYDDLDITIYEAMDFIMEDDLIQGMAALKDRSNALPIDYDELIEKVDKAWQDSLATSKAKDPLPETPIQEHTYTLPDPAVTISDRNSYGYTANELLPLSKERAIELREQDLTVYLLYEDNTEAMAFDREDIDNHSGIWGIEKADWTALQEYEKVKDDGKRSPETREQLFGESTDDSYTIYQLKGSEDLRNYRFEEIERLQSRCLSVEHDYNYEI